MYFVTQCHLKKTSLTFTLTTLINNRVFESIQFPKITMMFVKPNQGWRLQDVIDVGSFKQRRRDHGRTHRKPRRHQRSRQRQGELF